MGGGWEGWMWLSSMGSAWELEMGELMNPEPEGVACG